MSYFLNIFFKNMCSKNKIILGFTLLDFILSHLALLWHKNSSGRKYWFWQFPTQKNKPCSTPQTKLKADQGPHSYAYPNY